MTDKFEGKFTKYEVARILGARSLQLAMDAPILLKLSKKDEEDLNFDTLKTAERELESGVLPITVKRPLPKKSEKQVKKLSEEEIQEKLEKEKLKEEKELEKLEEKKEEIEEKVEKEIQEEGEIMEMAQPEDEEEIEEEDEKVEEV